MIKLKNSCCLVSLNGIRQVKKTGTSKGGYSCSNRFIEIVYQDGNTITINYGYDENYYNTSNPKLNEDFDRLSELLGASEL